MYIVMLCVSKRRQRQVELYQKETVNDPCVIGGNSVMLIPIFLLFLLDFGLVPLFKIMRQMLHMCHTKL